MVNFSLKTIKFIAITSILFSNCESHPHIGDKLKTQKVETTSTTQGKDCLKSLTIMLDAHNKLRYYVCAENGEAKSIDFSEENLKQLILKRQTEIAANWGENEKSHIYLKSSKKGSFRNLETAIKILNNGKSEFALMDLDKTDSTVFNIK